MHPFWDQVVEPLLDAADAEVVVEIGAERGLTTKLLLIRARERGGRVHAVDPNPAFEPGEWELAWGEHFRFHRARSLEVLPLISGVDAVLLDGDHNYYTVLNELKAIRNASTDEGRPLPLVIAHDVGWPYGRRDLYYDPASIPDGHRHDAARAGILPGRPELGEPGINRGLWNATHEGGPANGVLTAIEDFAGGMKRGGRIETLPGMHGLAVLVSADRLTSTPTLGPALDHFASPEFLRDWIERLELARIGAELRAAGSQTASPADRPAADRDRGLLD